MSNSRRFQKHVWFPFMAMIICTLLISGCGAVNPESEGAKEENTEANTRVIKHEAGETEIKGDPLNVVALEFSFVDALWELGVAPVGIAQENDDDIENLIGKPIQFTSVGTRQQPNLETISMLKPDLIIGDLNRHKAIYEDLSKIAPTIILKSRNSSYEENLSSFKTIAEVMNKKELGEKRLAQHEATMKELKAKIPAGETRKVMVGVFRADSLSAHGPESFDGQLLELAGIPNAITATKDATVKISLEQIVEWDPDVIFSAEADDKLLNEWKANPLWQNITAVKNNQVYEVNRSLWTRYRGISSAEKIVKEAIDLLYSSGM